MSEGLYEPITQGGTNVSGGQRQRLAIARALVKARHLCSTTASRPSTSRPIPCSGRRSNTNLSKMTVIIVAQRVSTIMHSRSDRGARQGTQSSEASGRHEDLIGIVRDLPRDRVLAVDRRRSGT